MNRGSWQRLAVLGLAPAASLILSTGVALAAPARTPLTTPTQGVGGQTNHARGSATHAGFGGARTMIGAGRTVSTDFDLGDFVDRLLEFVFGESANSGSNNSGSAAGSVVPTGSGAEPSSAGTQASPAASPHRPESSGAPDNTTGSGLGSMSAHARDAETAPDSASRAGPTTMPSTGLGDATSAGGANSYGGVNTYNEANLYSGVNSYGAGSGH